MSCGLRVANLCSVKAELASVAAGESILRVNKRSNLASTLSLSALAKDLLPELLELIVNRPKLFVHFGQLNLDSVRCVGRLPLHSVCLRPGDSQLTI